MPLAPRLFPGDEELGKRDDDHRPGTKSPLGMAWQQRRIPHGPPRRSLKRAAMVVIVLIAAYYFFKNMPTDLKIPRARPHYDHSPGQSSLTVGARGPPSDQGLMEEAKENSQYYFNGPIKFYQLASSLHDVSNTKGSELVNQNVLFAAASLKSASILLPIACEMAIRDKNYVHFAFMGRDDISMDVLKSVNLGHPKDCRIMFHDARPDFSPSSSEFRMEVSCSAAFNHINTFVHPQAVFIDASGEEEMFFLRGLKDRASSLGRTVIEMPDGAEQNLMWTTLLDSASLSAWNKVSIDILIHAPSSASGSLIRLLDSLKKADFFSSPPPRLIIELPHEVEEPTRRYLEHFRWPPNSLHNAGSLLTLHHRIPQHGLTAEENSIRFLEAFWPADPATSHLLVLSPQVELSPQFFHYLKYTMLEYKYSANKVDTQRNLLGISLDLPSTHLNDSATFTPPVGNDMTLFLWQAPNSNAALYFGDKWAELHDFVGQILASQRILPTPTTLNEKLVSKAYPYWLEHILSLSRARGYWTLYPNFENKDALATLHNELYQYPQEYTEDAVTDIGLDFTADPALYLRKHAEAPILTKSLLNMLPNNGNLPLIADMPLLLWDGQRIEHSEIGNYAVDFSRIFRHEIGGCEVSAIEKTRAELAAGDLFCLADASDRAE